MLISPEHRVVNSPGRLRADTVSPPCEWRRRGGVFVYPSIHVSKWVATERSTELRGYMGMGQYL